MSQPLFLDIFEKIIMQLKKAFPPPHITSHGQARELDQLWPPGHVLGTWIAQCSMEYVPDRKRTAEKRQAHPRPVYFPVTQPGGYSSPHCRQVFPFTPSYATCFLSQGVIKRTGRLILRPTSPYVSQQFRQLPAKFCDYSVERRQINNQRSSHCSQVLSTSPSTDRRKKSVGLSNDTSLAAHFRRRKDGKPARTSSLR